MSEIPNTGSQGQTESPVKSAPLLACPFCGGEASADGSTKYSKNHEAWFADGTRVLLSYFCNCIKCGASNNGLFGYQTREQAIKHWNTRSNANNKSSVFEPAAGEE